MMTPHNFIVAITGLLLLTQCKTKENSNRSTSSAQNSHFTERLAGEWIYNNTMWYSSELKLQNDGTFTFHDQGCYGQNFTEGQWTQDQDRIILSSYKTYMTPQKITPVETVSKRVKRQYKNKKGVIEFTVEDLKEIAPPKFPGPHDTVPVYFDRVQLKLKGDTIYCADNNKIIAEHKFSRSAN